MTHLSFYIVHRSVVPISNSIHFLDRLLQHLLPVNQLKAGRKIQLAYKEAATVSEEGDLVRPHYAAFSIVHRSCYQLRGEIQSRTSSGSRSVYDHFPCVATWSERVGAILKLIESREVIFS